MFDLGLKKREYSIRTIKEDDLDILLKWRNSNRIHSLMLTNHKITKEEHYKWYKLLKHNIPPRNLIFEYKKQPIGYIGYTEYDEETKTCSPGSYLGIIDYKIPIDAGIALMYMETEYAFRILNMERLISEIFAYNERVNKLNKLIGYKIIGEKDIYKNNRKEKIYVIDMDKNSWIKNKAIFLNILD